MKLIDFRCRPPFGSISSLGIFNVGAQGSRVTGPTVEPSIEKKSMPLFLQEMKEASIVHAVCPGRATPYCGGTATDNDDLAKLVTEYPDKFTAFAGINTSDAVAAIAEIEQCWKTKQFKGVALEPEFLNPPLHCDDPRFFPIYDKCQSMGIPIMLTLSCMAGNDISYSDPVHVDRICREFPKLTVIVGHACYPWVAQVCCVTLKRPNLYLCVDSYIAHFPGAQQWVEAANFICADKILFGSAYPLCSKRIMVEFWTKQPFKPEVLEKVLYKNAARLLGLPD